jgi:ADP-heptose:LPS heptosyltransferase
VQQTQNNLTLQKILIRRKAALGDVLLATSVLQPLKNRFPDFDIDFATDFPEILEKNKFIKNILPTTVPDTGYANIYNLDLAYELRPHCSILESYAAVIGIPITDLRLSVDIPDMAKQQATQLLNSRGILNNTPLIALQTAASFWVKNWPINAYQKVTDDLRSQLGVQPLVLGSLSDPILEGSIDLRGATDIMTSIAILYRCCAFIGVDSFLLHCAKIIGIPVAAFFGHSDPNLRIIIGTKDLIFTSDIECRFCHHRLKPPAITTICRKQNVLLQIMDTLFQKLQQFYYFNYSRLLTRMINFFWHLIEWREKGKVIAPCMKRITPECVSPKIIRWLRDIISHSERNPLGQSDPASYDIINAVIQDNGHK